MSLIPKRPLTAPSAVVAAGLLFVACSNNTEGDAQARATPPSAKVVATTTQVGSLAEQITACAGGETQTLMSASNDPHHFEASSAQIADMISADLVISNGLDLESAMQGSLDNAVADGANLLELAPQLDPLPYGDEQAHGNETHDDHARDDHGAYDPHVWLDMSRMADGAELIGEQLTTATHNETYLDCGQDIAAELRDVDAEIMDTLSGLEAPRLVTDHDAYSYFADRYGVEISGVVIPGGSTAGEPSSRDLVDLTALLDAEGADALVTSKTNTDALITALADETTNDVPVVALYESGIGEPGSGADTYQEAMLYNAKALADAVQ